MLEYGELKISTTASLVVKQAKSMGIMIRILIL